MANAGGSPPMICRKGHIIKPKVGGVPAGLMDDREYEEVNFDTEPGDVIVLYSDGITDQPNAKEEEYGRHNLALTCFACAGRIRKRWRTASWRISPNSPATRPCMTTRL